MKFTFPLASVFLLFWSCASQQEATASYPPNVGDSQFDPTLDDKRFKVCNGQNVLQYYNFGKGVQFEGEKQKIDAHFAPMKKQKYGDDSGFITIRFIVNCEGKTGRYWIQSMNNDYQPDEFDKSLITKLLSSTQSLEGWKVGEFDGRRFDYYQHLIFKIENGRLIEIMP